MKKHAAPIIVIVLLLLPVLYVGSYLALVTPGEFQRLSDGSYYWPRHYRMGNSWAGYVFFPLENVDRRIRPTVWEYQEEEDLNT